MFPTQFEYHRAGSVQEAIDLLGRHEGAKLLAGGHSLLPMMKLRLAQPPALIDIGRVGELAGVTRDGDRVRIGALTCHADVAASEELRRSCPLIAEAAGQIGDPQVRNRGTVGGNIAHADPASDLPAVLVAAGATVHLLGAGGSRQVAAKDFFQGLLTTALAEGEVITHVTVPVHGAGTGSCYLKVEHPASGYAVCGAAAVVTLAGDGRCTSAALCFNGVADVPADASAVAAALVGSEPTDAAIEAAVRDHLAIDEPLGDLFASGEYRVQLAKIHGRRALQQARDRARI
jgi:carbon-monoxide dehydrogenase medium subunit